MSLMNPVPALNPRASRHALQVTIRLHSTDAPTTAISSTATSINVSRTGVLMEIPTILDALVGQEVVVGFRWEGGDHDARATIVRFESPYHADLNRQAVALHFQSPLPPMVADLAPPQG
jgi:hypothetical protein